MASATGGTSAVSSSGASTMPDDTACHEALDFGNLRRPLVLAQRTAPDHRDVQFLRRLFGAGVDALPERVRRALRNDGDRELAGIVVRPQPDKATISTASEAVNIRVIK